MAKINPNRKIQKHRTEQEMRNAFQALYDSGGNMACRIADTDSPDVVMQDCIEELLEARQLLEDMRGFVSQWNAKFSRK